MSEKMSGMARKPIDVNFTAQEKHQDPFNEIELNVVFSGEGGEEWVVPGFWAGGDKWVVRFSAPKPGSYQYISQCSGTQDPGLHDVKGELAVTKYEGHNPLYLHGPVKVMDNGRYFEHEDGTPFFWLGDTWWNLLSSRIKYPEELKVLTDDRVDKGFTVIGIVNGLWCDLAPFDERMNNAAGYAWTEEFGTINPEYFNLAEKKIEALVDAGLVPYILGTWGFYMRFLGLEKIKKHYRYMVARYSAYPVMWVLAGETTMPYYDYGFGALMQKGIPEDFDMSQFADLMYAGDQRKQDWSDVFAYLKDIDPYKRIASVHVTGFRTSFDDINNPELLDFTMWQGTHDENHDEIYKAVTDLTKKLYDSEPKRPVVNSECCYEGMLYKCREEVQRFIFWHSFLNGCAGWTYGANGVFTASHKDDPFGTAYYKLNWGEQTWQEAMNFDGGKQVGAGSKFLGKFDWWRLQPAPDKVDNSKAASLWNYSVAAEIPNELIIVYFNPEVAALAASTTDGAALKNLEPGAKYQVVIYNPIRDYEVDLGDYEVGPDGALVTSKPPVPHDWVYVLRRK